MVRRIQFAGLALAVVALVGVPAAQAQRRGGFGGDPLLGLLQIEKVQIELDLLDVQVDEGEVIAAAIDKQFPRPQINFQEATDKERDAFMTKMQELTAKRGKVVKAKLAEMLAPDQYARLVEISIQQRGSSALSDAGIAKQLKLTAAQQKKIADIAATLSQSMRKLFSGGFGGDREKMRAQMTKMRTDAEKQTLAALTPAQNKQFTALKGKKFELPQRRFGGGGRGKKGKKKGN